MSSCGHGINHDYECQACNDGEPFDKTDEENLGSIESCQFLTLSTE